ncbi:hypothetical protein FQN55_000792 [Onygenales sp. PD_40]|nr:hypothetical protein FQN55_000792 [Onygenales sp. PD_40]
MASSSDQKYPSVFNVALIQMNPKPLDPAYNFNQAVSYIRDAASKGASLAVLPEYHLTSWSPESPQFPLLATKAWAYVHKYQELAKELHINLVPGTIVTTDPNLTSPDAASEIPEPDRDDFTTTNPPTSSGSTPKLFNIAPFISHSGELLGIYTKANLWLTERAYLASHPPIPFPLSPQTPKAHNNSRPAAREPPAQRHSVINTPLGPIGLLTCWDLAFPEAFRALIRQGARIIVIPSFWLNVDIPAEAARYARDTEARFLKATLVARAFENTCAVVFCNVGGPVEEEFIGLSRVALPLVGAVEGGFEGAEVGVRVVKVEMETVDIAEGAYGVRADMGREGWHYGGGGG